MRITKTIYRDLTYYECEVNKGQYLFAFSLRRLIVDLITIYSYSIFRPLNLN